MPSSSTITSWSHAVTTHTDLVDYEQFSIRQPASYIPRGGGCSFGDASFLTDGMTVSTEALGRLELDAKNRYCYCGAGVTLGELHRFLIRNEMLFPIYGGTQWATVGGAIASDIHGKNQLTAGTFGNHVAAITLHTPLSGKVVCSRENNSELFHSTIGGMGLTGLVEEAQLLVTPGKAPALTQTRRKFRSYAEMIALLDSTHEYQFASIFKFSDSAHGFYFCADSVDVPPPELRAAYDLPGLPNISLINNHTIGIADWLAHWAGKTKKKVSNRYAFNYSGVHQRLRQTNRLLCKSGVIEYHYNLPRQEFISSLSILSELLKRYKVIATHGVIKRFGIIPPEGLISFVREGYTLNFQVINNFRSRAFLKELTDKLTEIGARYYLAKDCCLSARHFRLSTPTLPEWQKITQQWDPQNQIRSDLATRLELKPW